MEQRVTRNWNRGEKLPLSACPLFDLQIRFLSLLYMEMGRHMNNKSDCTCHVQFGSKSDHILKIGGSFLAGVGWDICSSPCRHFLRKPTRENN